LGHKVGEEKSSISPEKKKLGRMKEANKNENELKD
jgi:hypothetical protein